jgi:hypothetical protein
MWDEKKKQERERINSLDFKFRKISLEKLDFLVKEAKDIFFHIDTMTGLNIAYWNVLMNEIHEESKRCKMEDIKNF